MEEVEDDPILPLQTMYSDIVRRHPGGPDAVMCGTDQSDGHPTINVAALPRVGLLPFCCKDAGYAFICSFRLHAKEAKQ